MESLDYWRLCDELNVIQAAILIAGEDPSSLQSYIEDWDPEKRPDGYEAAKAAIKNGLLCETITGTLVPIYEYDINGNELQSLTNTVDLERSRVDAPSLRDWLSVRGLDTGFFFSTETDAPDYLDPSHPRYAPKLAAAVNAWLALDDGSILKGKTPKQALLKWLRESAAEYRLSDEDGKPNETGIEECAKVANWKDKGGAPKTLS